MQLCRLTTFPYVVTVIYLVCTIICYLSPCIPHVRDVLLTSDWPFTYCTALVTSIEAFIYFIYYGSFPTVLADNSNYNTLL